MYVCSGSETLKHSILPLPSGESMKQLRIRLLVLILASVLKAEVAQAAAPVAKPGCKDTCGNVSIPFPFGIGANCYLDFWFEIDCKVPPTSSGSVKPFLSKVGIEVMNMDFNYSSNIEKYLMVLIPPTNSCIAHKHLQRSIDLSQSPYQFTRRNVFVVEGCPGSAVMFNESEQIMAGCDTTCSSNYSDIPTSGCYGVKCCHVQPAFDHYLQFYHTTFGSLLQNCLLAGLVYFHDYIGKLSTSQPTQLSWEWGGYKFNKSSDSTCLFVDNGNVFVGDGQLYDGDVRSCKCNTGFEGNPYFPGGCQVAQVCKACPGTCIEQDNRYKCNNEERLKKALSTRTTPAVILGLGISSVIALLVIGNYGLYRVVKRRREATRRSKFFKRNGGLLLQQQVSSKEGVVERTKIFSTSELDKATDQFSENRILGQGGQGVVYKGILSDGRTVAIKKSKLLHKSQLKQFINEVVILSRINHRNVVKLLGCCLETEVPLLVYEYIPNGTLSQHIHDPDEDFVMSWETRLKIAADSAGAIAYLHSSSSTPVYHRDIKSANILLDERLGAKVSDFGCSKTIAMDQTHLTTLVQGTMGYLDPEYSQSSQFTEKSDVYSFGVVLLELLTSKKPIYRGVTMEQKSLVKEFQDSRVFDIFDHEVVKEAKEEELKVVVQLTKRCLSWSGKLRPTMKEVATTLEMIVKSPAQVSTLNKEDFLDEFGESVMSQTSDEGFMSNPLPEVAGIGSPLYTDVRPLLHDTI